jgi:hypothetical protein
MGDEDGEPDEELQCGYEGIPRKAEGAIVDGVLTIAYE